MRKWRSEDPQSIICISYAAEFCHVLVAGGHHSIYKQKQTSGNSLHIKWQ